MHVLPQPQAIVLFLPLFTRCLHWPLPQMWCWTAIGSFPFSMFWINFTASFTSASLAVQRIRFVVMCLNMKIWIILKNCWTCFEAMFDVWCFPQQITIISRVWLYYSKSQWMIPNWWLMVHHFRTFQISTWQLEMSLQVAVGVVASCATSFVFVQWCTSWLRSCVYQNAGWQSCSRIISIIVYYNMYICINTI